MKYQDRKDAGKKLAEILSKLEKPPNAIVLGIAQGGAIVAYEIARELSLPFNVLASCKIRSPKDPNLAIGVMSDDGNWWIDPDLITAFQIDPPSAMQAITKARERIEKQRALYRSVAPLQNLADKTVLLVDDGAATGTTFLVEILSLRKMGAKTVIAIAPVSSAEGWLRVQQLASIAICPKIETNFSSVSSYYADFSPVSDELILRLLS